MHQTPETWIYIVKAYHAPIAKLYLQIDTIHTERKGKKRKPLHREDEDAYTLAYTGTEDTEDRTSRA